MHRLKNLLFALMAVIGLHECYAQEKGATLTLEDMAAFRKQAGNWQIVGGVVINPLVEIHHADEAKPAEPASKKKKKKTDSATTPEAVTVQPGKGILVNLNDASRKDQLITTWEHGDIELELEVMIPKGSNSGIYLQGRYEVQLLDSWGVKDPKYSDIGGIYRNWETEPGKIYMGKAPLTNPAKAPGTWQKLRISFRAPRFDASGNKIANARFVFVELNGVRIHDNLEVPLPTGGPIENNEKAMGPLMIQGDHGPVAFRHISYRLMKEGAVQISPVTYAVYHGSFKTTNDFKDAKPAYTGTSNLLTCEVLDIENSYGIHYKGTITVPEDNDYIFTLSYSGGSVFTVNNQVLENYQRFDGWRSEGARITLKAGTYPFEIINFKDASWQPPRLKLQAETSETYKQTLTAYGSFPPDENPTAAILLNAGATPRLLRAFVDFKGDRRRRLTHTIGVGDPTGVNYVYDLDAGNIACVWRGDFVDATPMWHDRGDGSFRPRGAAQYLFMSQPLAFLATDSEAFPVTGKEGDFRTKGYTIEESTGRPVFHYRYKNLEVDDQVWPDDNNRSIAHRITVKSKEAITGLYYKLAEGSTIVALPGGLYAIDDQQYFIRADASLQPLIRDVNGKKELVVKFTGAAINYSIVW